jgi:outer membrane protein, adhesin transport system
VEAPPSRRLLRQLDFGMINRGDFMQFIQKRALFLLLGLLGLMAVGSVQAALPEPVRQAILEAVNTNPEVQERWHAFLAAEEGQGVARGGYYPEVDLRLSAARQWQDSNEFGRVDRDPLSATLTLNQMLYDGFFTRSEVRRLGHARLVRYYELLEAAERAALEAIRAYADVERHRELVFLAEENYRAHRDVFGQVEELTRTGVGRGVDLEQASGRLALAESNLLTEVANLHDVSARFLRVVGRMPTEDFVELIGVLPDGQLPPTSHQAQLEALSSNPAMFAAVENILSAQEQVRAGRANFHPRLDLQVRQSRDNALNSLFQEDSDIWVNDTTAGVVLTFNLFRGFADQSRVGQFVEETNMAKDNREIVCRNVRQEVTIAFNDVQVLNKRLEYLDQHQLSSDRVRTAYRQQFTIGQRTLLDLLDAENEFFVARRAFVDGQFDREISVARTLAGLGRLLPALDIARDAMPEIKEVTTIDPEQICPPVAPPAIEVDRAPPATPVFTTSDRLGTEAMFPFGSATLTPEGREALRGLASGFTAPDADYTTILVEGHTCSIGPEDYNQDLSERRARSVADHLVSLGVRRDAIRIVGHGEGRPIADNATREGRVLNRRVEVSTDVRNGGG